MLPYALIIIGVLLLAALLGICGAEEPGNAVEHHQADEPCGEDEPDLTSEASAAAAA